MFHLFYSSTAVYRSFLLLLDEAEECIQKGETPIFLTCDGTLTRYCFGNVSGNRNVCRLCRWMRKHSFPALSKDVKNITIASLLTESQIQRIQNMHFEYSCINEIHDIHYNSVDIGYAALSHYIACTRNYSPVITPEFRKVIDEFMRTSVFLTEAIEEVLEQYPILAVSLFNGRTFDSRPVLRKSVSHGIATSVLEIINRKNRLEKITFKNSLPHNVNMQGERILSIWETAVVKDEQQAHQLAETFFINRRSGRDAGDRVYTTDQLNNLLPANWDIHKQNIVFFTSSEDEFASIDNEWDSFKYSETQIECVIKILHLMSRNESHCHLYVRLHPNLKGITFSYHTDFYKLEQKFPNVTVIPPESPISTYALMDNADKVAVFGSTVGIESVYWQKPVILLGPAYYRMLGGCYIPQDDIDLNNLIFDKLAPKNNISALQYGYSIMGDVGTPFTHLDITLFWPDMILKKIIRNERLRTKILKRLIPALNNCIRFIQQASYLRARRSLHKLDTSSA